MITKQSVKHRISGRAMQGSRNRQAILDYLNAQPGSMTKDVAKELGLANDTVRQILLVMNGVGVFRKRITVDRHLAYKWYASVRDQGEIQEKVQDKARNSLAKRAQKREQQNQPEPAKQSNPDEPWRTIHLMDKRPPYKNQRGQGAAVSHYRGGSSVLSGGKE